MWKCITLKCLCFGRWYCFSLRMNEKEREKWCVVSYSEWISTRRKVWVRDLRNKFENNLTTVDWTDYKARWHVPIFSNKGGKKQSEDRWNKYICWRKVSAQNIGPTKFESESHKVNAKENNTRSMYFSSFHFSYLSRQCDMFKPLFSVSVKWMCS